MSLSIRIPIRLNQKFYASLGEKQAFVLSHGRNMMILKIVGYAELVAKYYLLDNFKAHGWIAHQRYPTKGASGIRAALIPSSGWMKPWCTTAISPTTIPSPNI